MKRIKRYPRNPQGNRGEKMVAIFTLFYMACVDLGNKLDILNDLKTEKYKGAILTKVTAGTTQINEMSQRIGIVGKQAETNKQTWHCSILARQK